MPNKKDEKPNSRKRKTNDKTAKVEPKRQQLRTLMPRPPQSRWGPNNEITRRSELSASTLAQYGYLPEPNSPAPMPLGPRTSRHAPPFGEQIVVRSRQLRHRDVNRNAATKVQPDVRSQAGRMERDPVTGLLTGRNVPSPANNLMTAQQQAQYPQVPSNRPGGRKQAQNMPPRASPSATQWGFNQQQQQQQYQYHYQQAQGYTPFPGTVFHRSITNSSAETLGHASPGGMRSMGNGATFQAPPGSGMMAAPLPPPNGNNMDNGAVIQQPPGSGMMGASLSPPNGNDMGNWTNNQTANMQFGNTFGMGQGLGAIQPHDQNQDANLAPLVGAEDFMDFDPSLFAQEFQFDPSFMTDPSQLSNWDESAVQGADQLWQDLDAFFAANPAPLVPNLPPVPQYQQGGYGGALAPSHFPQPPPADYTGNIDPALLYEGSQMPFNPPVNPSGGFGNTHFGNNNVAAPTSYAPQETQAQSATPAYPSQGFGNTHFGNKSLATQTPYAPQQTQDQSVTPANPSRGFNNTPLRTNNPTAQTPYTPQQHPQPQPAYHFQGTHTHHQGGSYLPPPPPPPAPFPVQQPQSYTNGYVQQPAKTTYVSPYSQVNPRGEEGLPRRRGRPPAG